VRHFRVHECHHFVRRQRTARNHERFRHLAGFVVGHRDHGHVRDIRVLEQQRLELGGRHLEALDLDELLQSIDHRELTAAVDHADVPGA
jgi:hypothetical protein